MSASSTSTELAKLCWANSWSAAEDRLERYGGECRHADANLVLPLHIAVWHKAPMSLINELLRIYPDAVGKKTSGGHFPVDYAKLFNNEDPELIERLNPQELIEKDMAKEIEQNTSTELHKLCFWKFREASDRLAVYPEEATFQDDNGNLALHIAVEHQSPVKLINELLAANPASAWHANRVGKLPLHVAAQSWAKIPVIQALVSAYPTAVNSTDNQGELPINFAMQEYPDQEVLKLLEPHEPSTPKWIKLYDESSGSYYYENQFNKETSWEKPSKGFFE